MKKLTEKEFAKCIKAGNMAAEEIPSSACRKQAKARAKTTMDAIAKATAKKRDLRDDELIGKKVKVIYKEPTNLSPSGSRRHGDWYMEWYEFTADITHMTGKTLFYKGVKTGIDFRKAKSTILCVVF